MEKHATPNHAAAQHHHQQHAHHPDKISFIASFVGGFYNQHNDANSCGHFVRHTHINTCFNILLHSGTPTQNRALKKCPLRAIISTSVQCEAVRSKSAHKAICLKQTIPWGMSCKFLVLVSGLNSFPLVV
ncbi:unnamed protein product [Ceratitis capitata]|uniref:(Mediterranean fruit fly) hypothetical protein n=1 Tax=Ceratitis capitata TaxID=7213 RepID=A0A811U0J9_CERCA|nr:unnamed protein product [Ceratitis capitata]